jgi:hypothetical protein
MKTEEHFHIKGQRHKINDPVELVIEQPLFIEQL